MRCWCYLGTHEHTHKSKFLKMSIHACETNQHDKLKDTEQVTNKHRLKLSIKHDMKYNKLTSPSCTCLSHWNMRVRSRSLTRLWAYACVRTLWHAGNNTIFWSIVTKLWLDTPNIHVCAHIILHAAKHTPFVSRKNSVPNPAPCAKCVWVC